MTQEQLRKRFEGREEARVVMEAGTHSPWASRLLKECGHEVIVANPRKLRMIYESDDKHDPQDAEMLGRLGRVDPQLLCPIQHRGAEAQADLALLRARDALVKARSQLINHVRGAIKAVGYRIDRSSSESFHKKAAGQVPPELRAALTPVIETIGKLTEQIRGQDAQVEQMGEKKYPETQRLRQVAGVGPLTSLAYVLTIEDPKRFKKSREVGPYLGGPEIERRTDALSAWP